MTWHDSPPRVALVGAGPGDPGLLTLRGRALLEQAEVVVYDALANPKLLSYCPQAEKVYVGKRAAAHAMTQEQINALLVEHGRAGRRVVRLKGGDPFVFGRGGEECLALREAGVPFEVVPGITAAIAAPAYAGIPVTHRDFNSSFTLITGHEKEEAYQDPAARSRQAGAGSDLDWSAIARLPGMAFYMGLKALPRICTRLIEHGMDPATPAASIQWGTTSRQRTVTGTIADLPQRIAEAGLSPPAMTIIGPTVALRETLNWFESRPLFGQTIVVTRTRQQASELSERLEAAGANVLEVPTIELGPPADAKAVDRALVSAGTYDWIVFTSANGVRAARQRLREIGQDVRVFGQAKIAAVGAATAQAIEVELALKVDLCPQQAVAEALADALASQGQVSNGRFLLLRADIARPVLRERLEHRGAAAVDDVAIYETRTVSSLPEELLHALDQRQVDWITFTSSSTARNLTTLLGQDYARRLDDINIASIGPITTQTLRELGLEPVVQAESANVQGLVQALLRHISKRSG